MKYFHHSICFQEWFSWRVFNEDLHWRELNISLETTHRFSIIVNENSDNNQHFSSFPEHSMQLSISYFNFKFFFLGSFQACIFTLKVFLSTMRSLYTNRSHPRLLVFHRHHHHNWLVSIGQQLLIQIEQLALSFLRFKNFDLQTRLDWAEMIPQILKLRYLY